LNIFQRFGSNHLMSHPKLLKAPARVLLLTFVMSTRMAVGAPASAAHMASMPAQGQRVVTAAGFRVRQPFEEMDAYILLHGVPRWGLNE
jgi:hypothetical protein